MHRKICIALLISLLTGGALFAGDVANFVNLGFSEDSNTFMFGQYGVRSHDTRAYAEIYTVDVAKNRFVKGGVEKNVFDTEIESGQNGRGALFELLHEVEPLVDRYDIRHLATGRVVYLLIDGDEPKKRLEFRDFYRGDSYVLTLVQQKLGDGDDVKASFHINLSVTNREGETDTYTLGLPDYARDGVLSYRIKQVFFSPDEGGIVCVVEKHMQAEGGKNIRYMVETVQIK